MICNGLHSSAQGDAATRGGRTNLLHAVREKVRELAPQRRRFGFRRLGLMLERQGIKGLAAGPRHRMALHRAR
jgi:hypothetical protein